MAKKKQKKPRRRVGLKKLTAGGSYAIRQGRMGGGIPYFINFPQPEQKPVEVQLPPSFLDHMKRIEETGKGLGGAFRAWAGPLVGIGGLGMQALTHFAPRATAEYTQTMKNEQEMGKADADDKARAEMFERDRMRRQQEAEQAAKLNADKQKQDDDARGEQIINDLKKAGAIAGDIRENVNSFLGGPPKNFNLRSNDTAAMNAARFKEYGTTPNPYYQGPPAILTPENVGYSVRVGKDYLVPGASMLAGAAVAYRMRPRYR